MPSYAIPDVTFSSVNPITIEVAGSHIPVGTVVHLRITPEGGGVIDTNTTPLAGADDSATSASATATMPHGVSRFFVTAS